MLVYYILWGAILVLGWPLCIRWPSKINKAVYLTLIFGYMWFLATFREGIGFDYKTYITLFQWLPDVNSSERMLELLNYYEPGFILVSKLMACFISSPVAMYGVYAAMVLIPVVIFIWRHCEDVWLSTWLYVTLTFFYTSMNFIRQSIACSIILLGYGFLKNKKAVPFILVVLIAASFHKTSLIMIPIYFLCQIKLNKKTGIIYASVTMLGYLCSGLILDFVTKYAFSGYKDTFYLTEGMPLIFLIVPFSLFGACLALSFTWAKRDPAATVLLNLMMYSAIIWLFITRHFIVERFSMPIYIFSLAAVPSAIRALKASPETLESHAALSLELDESSKKTKPSKEKLAQLRVLAINISDHKKYYWCAVAALLVLTAAYNDFGANINHFHNVFPYQSVFEWLN